MQPEKGQLDEDEQEEAQQLCAGDMGALGEVVREVVELRPDGRDHDLEALAALEGLRPEPDARDDASDEDGEVGPSDAKRRARQHREVDAEDAAHVAVQHRRHADEDVPDEDGQDGEAGVEALGDRGGRHWPRIDKSLATCTTVSPLCVSRGPSLTLIHGNGKGFGDPEAKQAGPAPSPLW